MKTKLTKENFLVLTNKENKIIAIIQCHKGHKDIIKKLAQAIREDYDADAIIFFDASSEVLTDFDCSADFKVLIKVDGDEYEESLTLTSATVY